MSKNTTMRNLRALTAMPFVIPALIFFMLAVFSMLIVDTITGRNHSRDLFNW